jgi:hypothetical protein
MSHTTPESAGSHEGSRSLTIAQFAARHSMSTRAVWSLIASGELRAVKLGPRTTRILETDAEDFVRRCLERGRPKSATGD